MGSSIHFDKAAFPLAGAHPPSNSIIIVPVIFISFYHVAQFCGNFYYFFSHFCQFLITFLILLIFKAILITFIIYCWFSREGWHNSVFARQSSCLLSSQDSLELDFPPEKNFRRRSLLIGNTKKEPLERNRNCWQDYGTL